jgi:hypothetical protein
MQYVRTRPPGARRYGRPEFFENGDLQRRAGSRGVASTSVVGGEGARVGVGKDEKDNKDFKDEEQVIYLASLVSLLSLSSLLPGYISAMLRSP